MKDLFVGFIACTLIELLQITGVSEAALVLTSQLGQPHEPLELVDVIVSKVLQVLITFLAIYKLYLEDKKKKRTKQ